MKNLVSAAVFLSGILLFGGIATAQETTPVEPAPGFGDAEPELLSEMGMALTIGGAFSDFTDENARDFTDFGAGWEARYTIGTRTRIGAEAAYVGTANELDALGVEEDAFLVSNGLEGAARLNILTDAFQPYVVAGIGWKHYEVTNTDVNTSAVRDSEDAVTVPLGAGLAYRYDNLVLDLRANIKPAFSDDITRTGGDDDTSLTSYGAQANLGFEF